MKRVLLQLEKKKKIKKNRLPRFPSWKDKNEKKKKNLCVSPWIRGAFRFENTYFSISNERFTPKSWRVKVEFGATSVERLRGEGVQSRILWRRERERETKSIGIVCDLTETRYAAGEKEGKNNCSRFVCSAQCKHTYVPYDCTRFWKPRFRPLLSGGCTCKQMGEGKGRSDVAPATRDKEYLIYANSWSRVLDNSVERLSIFPELSFLLGLVKPSPFRWRRNSSTTLRVIFFVGWLCSGEQ